MRQNHSGVLVTQPRLQHLTFKSEWSQPVNVILLDASEHALLQRSFVPETHQHQEEFELRNELYFLRKNIPDTVPEDNCYVKQKGWILKRPSIKSAFKELF